MISERVKFRQVAGAPRGGLRLAAALEKYVSPDVFRSLIVDDVLTTGKSMQEMREKLLWTNTCGYVIFARGYCMPWINALFFCMPNGLGGSRHEYRTGSPEGS